MLRRETEGGKEREDNDGDGDAHEGTSVAEETRVVALAFEDEMDLLEVRLEVDFYDCGASEERARGGARGGAGDRQFRYHSVVAQSAASERRAREW